MTDLFGRKIFKMRPFEELIAAMVARDEERWKVAFDVWDGEAPENIGRVFRASVDNWRCDYNKILHVLAKTSSEKCFEGCKMVAFNPLSLFITCDCFEKYEKELLKTVVSAFEPRHLVHFAKDALISEKFIDRLSDDWCYGLQNLFDGYGPHYRRRRDFSYIYDASQTYGKTGGNFPDYFFTPYFEKATACIFDVVSTKEQEDITTYAQKNINNIVGDVKQSRNLKFLMDAFFFRVDCRRGRDVCIRGFPVDFFLAITMDERIPEHYPLKYPKELFCIAMATSNIKTAAALKKFCPELEDEWDKHFDYVYDPQDPFRKMRVWDGVARVNLFCLFEFNLRIRISWTTGHGIKQHTISHHQLLFERWFLNMFLRRDPRTDFRMRGLDFLDNFNEEKMFYPFAGARYCFDDRIQYTEKDIQHAFDMMKFTLRECDTIETIGQFGMDKHSLLRGCDHPQGMSVVLGSLDLHENSRFFLKLCVEEYRKNLEDVSCGVCRILKHNYDKGIPGIHSYSIKTLLDVGFSPNELYPYIPKERRQKESRNAKTFLNVSLLGMLMLLSWNSHRLDYSYTKTPEYINWKSVHNDFGHTGDDNDKVTIGWATHELSGINMTEYNKYKKLQDVFLKKYINYNRNCRIQRPRKKKWGIQKFQKNHQGPENWFHAPTALVQLLTRDLLPRIKSYWNSTQLWNEHENRIVSNLFDKGLDPNWQMEKNECFPLWAGATALFHAHTDSFGLVISLLKHPEVDLELTDVQCLRADQMLNRRSHVKNLNGWGIMSVGYQTIFLNIRWVRMQRKICREMKKEIVIEYIKTQKTQEVFRRLVQLPTDLQTLVVRFAPVPFLSIEKRDLFLQWEVLNRI